MEIKLIYDLAFQWDRGDYLSCSSSNSDTVHIWRCKTMAAFGKDAETIAPVVNTGSYFSGLASMIKYTGSQWSFAQVRVSMSLQQKDPHQQPDQVVHTRQTKAIVVENQVVVGTHCDGVGLMVCANLGEQGGDCKLISQTAISTQ